MAKPERRPLCDAWSKGSFKDMLRIACSILFIQSFNDDQKKALQSFFKDRHDIYYSAPTGHGKSVCFQAMPIIADEISGLANGTSKLLVITPLKSLMEDQVRSLTEKTAVSAAAIYQGQEDSILHDIEEDGLYSII